MGRTVVAGFYESKASDLIEYKVRQSYPITGLDRPIGLQEFEAPRICR
jgi:hypothetical protein